MAREAACRYKKSGRACRGRWPPFVERSEHGQRQRSAARGGDMAEYLVLFNDEWVPDLTEEDLREASQRVRALRAEMTAAGSPHLHRRTGRRCARIQCRCVEWPPAHHRRSLRRDQGAARRLRRHRCGRRGGCAVVGGKESRWRAVGPRRCDGSGTRLTPRGAVASGDALWRDYPSSSTSQWCPGWTRCRASVSQRR